MIEQPGYELHSYRHAASRIGFAAILAGMLYLCAAAGEALAQSESSTEYIEVAKRIPTELCPGQTLEAVANVFFDSPRWEQSRAQDGSIVVHVIGSPAKNNNKLVVARISYTLDVQLGSLKFRAMDITGIQQPRAIYTVLVKPACRSVSGPGRQARK